MLRIATTRQHPRPAIYHGPVYIRDCGDNLSKEAWGIEAANRALALDLARQLRIEAGKRALAICGRLGRSRERLTRKTMISANKAGKLL